MFISELFKPNKFGNVPLVTFSGMHVFKELGDSYACSLCTIKKETLVSEVSDNIYRAASEAHRGNVYVEQRFLVPATAENILIQKAILGGDFPKEGAVFVLTQDNRLIRVASGLNPRILPDGTGWVRGLDAPVTFYLEDILYRLDLQEKST